MPNFQQIYPFYPKIEPNNEYTLQTSELHNIYYASYGNENGIPVAVLHGGPGSGTSPYYAQFFDPAKYHIILIDQRGSGKSTPKGETRENTPQNSIADMEKIREHLHIDQWVVFGGSWGSTLALLYAEAHPNKVLGLILRGIYLARKHDTSAFTREGCPAAQLHSREWGQFKLDTTTLIKQAGLTNLSVENNDINNKNNDINNKNNDINHIYYELLHCKKEISENAAGTMAAWEKLNSFLEINKEELLWSRSPDGVNMGLMEMEYFENNCFLLDNQILNQIHRLQGIQTYIVQGKYDLVCPPYQADDLETALLEINADKNLIVRYDPVAGHSHKEEGNRSALIFAGNELAKQLRWVPKTSSNAERNFFRKNEKNSQDFQAESKNDTRTSSFF